MDFVYRFKQQFATVRKGKMMRIQEVVQVAIQMDLWNDGNMTLLHPKMGSPSAESRAGDFAKQDRQNPLFQKSFPNQKKTRSRYVRFFFMHSRRCFMIPKDPNTPKTGPRPQLRPAAFPDRFAGSVAPPHGARPDLRDLDTSAGTCHN